MSRNLRGTIAIVVALIVGIFIGYYLNDRPRIVLPDPDSAPSPVQTADLVLVSENASRDPNGGTVDVNGEFRNDGTTKIDSINATTVWRDAKGEIVKSTKIYVGFDPLMPGQTSPFHVMEMDNPLITSEYTTFEDDNGIIPTTGPNSYPVE